MSTFIQKFYSTVLSAVRKSYVEMMKNNVQSFTVNL